MKNLVRSIAVLALVSLLSACATPLGKQEIAAIKVIAIQNDFPEYPHLASIGTTIFNNEIGRVESAEYKLFVAEVVAKHLGAKGYTVNKPEASAAALPRADLVLRLIPRDAYERVGTMGYGFYQRSMFGLKTKPASYVALNIMPLMDGKSRGGAYYRESFMALSIAELPTDWRSMSPALKTEFDQSLKTNIEKTVTSLLDEIGL